MAIMRLTHPPAASAAAPEATDEAGEPDYTSAVVAAAADAKTSPRPVAVVVGLAAIAAGSILGWVAFKRFHPHDLVIDAAYGAFAGLFVLAQALERLLEPFTNFIPPSSETWKRRRNVAVAKALRTRQHGHAKDAAIAQAKLDQVRADRVVILWGLATALATVASPLLGLYLLRTISASGAAPNRFLDLVVTGLVVGSGTKPLHDLVAGIQKKKEVSGDPPELTGGR